MTDPTDRLKLWEAWTFDADGTRIELGKFEEEYYSEALLVAEICAMERDFDYLKVQVKLFDA